MMTRDGYRAASALEARAGSLEEFVRPDAMDLIRRNLVHLLSAEVDA